MREPREIALELYSRGFTATRQEAVDLTIENPAGVAFLLNLPPVDHETRNRNDIASVDEWGHAGFPPE